MTDPILELRDVTRAFGTGRHRVRAVDRLALTLEAGEILCLVGESGCGKSTTARLAAGLLEPSAGQVLFQGMDIWDSDRETFSRYRRAVQIVHQDPYAALNPTHTVAKIVSAPLRHHRLAVSKRAAEDQVKELLKAVDLTPPEEFLPKYPHQLSGGQRQRVAVARALTLNPQFIVADEAVSMVDVSIRVSLLNLLLRLNDQLGVTFLFITHDLALARYFAWHGRIAVMYLGQIVEIGGTPRLIESPMHPYTRALLAAIPEADPDLTRNKPHLSLRSQEVPSLLNIPSGCRFHPRCPLFEEGLCERQAPDLASWHDGHRVACHVTTR